MKFKEGSIADTIWGFSRLIAGILPLILIILYFNLLYFITYLALGLFTFLFINHKFKIWGINAFVFTIVLWPVCLLCWKDFFEKKNQTLLDKFNELVDKNPILKLQKEYFEKTSKNGTDQDVIPWGVGEFGLEVTNPIPVHGIFGSRYYLRRLKTANGDRIMYERTGSIFESNIIKSPVDAYKIMVDNVEIATLYISPYHKKNSQKAPKGFKLVF
jgi:hypothetical protein